MTTNSRTVSPLYDSVIMFRQTTNKTLQHDSRCLLKKGLRARFNMECRNSGSWGWTSVRGGHRFTAFRFFVSRFPLKRKAVRFFLLTDFIAFRFFIARFPWSVQPGRTRARGRDGGLRNGLKILRNFENFPFRGVNLMTDCLPGFRVWALVRTEGPRLKRKSRAPDGGRETVHKFFEISKISTITKEFQWPIAVQALN